MGRGCFARPFSRRQERLTTMSEVVIDTEFAAEGLWHNHASSGYEAGWRAEVGDAVGAKVVAEVGADGDVEALENQAEGAVLTELNACQYGSETCWNVFFPREEPAGSSAPGQSGLAVTPTGRKSASSGCSRSPNWSPPLFLDGRLSRRGRRCEFALRIRQRARRRL